MELLKIFLKDEVTAVGLSKFKDARVKKSYEQQKYVRRKQIFKPNYSNNFFIL